MKTVIANDRIARFAELDHAVLEEVRVIMETPTVNESAETPRPLDRLCTALQKAVRPGRAS